MPPFPLLSRSFWHEVGDLIAQTFGCLGGWVYIYLSLLLLLDMRDSQWLPEHTKKV